MFSVSGPAHLVQLQAPFSYPVRKTFLHEYAGDASVPPSLQAEYVTQHASRTPPTTRQLRRVPASQQCLKTRCRATAYRTLSHENISRGAGGDMWQHYDASEGKVEDNPIAGYPNQEEQRDQLDHKSYHDLHIISMYGMDESGNSMLWNRPRSTKIEETITEESSEDLKAVKASISHPPSPTQSDLEDDLEDDLEEEAKSRESSWLANESSHDERIRRFNARCCQVVQHSSSTPKAVEEANIMVATVVVGPGKPRLVQILRPSSSDNSAQASTNPSPRTDELDNTPSTPERDRNEISVFSPDTSGCDTPFTELSSSVRLEKIVKRDRPQLTFRTTNLSAVPARISSLRQLTGAVQTAEPINSFQDTRLADPFDSPISSGSSYSSCHSSFFGTTNVQKSCEPEPGPEVFPRRPSPRRTVSGLRKYQLVRAVSATTKALDALAEKRFNLESIELQAVRNDLSLKAARLIETLQSIFGTSTSTALGELVAWLIHEYHFTAILESSGDSSTLPAIRGHKRTTRMWGRPDWSPVVASDAYWERIATLSTEHLNSLPSVVPSKAQQVLGMGVSTSMSTLALSRSSSGELARLEDRARVVHDEIQAAGRRLIRDLAGVQAANQLWDATKVVARFILQ